MKDIKETIAKLLRLSKSDNEAEAMSALLKAQELMAKYKVEEYECVDLGIKKRNLKRIRTGLYFSKLSFPYTIDLGEVIADNFLCECFFTHRSYERKREITFVGLEEDVELCTITMEFAYKAIISEMRKLKVTLKNKGLNTYTVNVALNSYMKGWVEGLDQKMKEKRAKEIQENETYALVLVKPVEVTDYIKHMKSENIHVNDIIYNDVKNLGKEDGYNFDLNTQLDTNNNKLTCNS